MRCSSYVSGAIALCFVDDGYCNCDAALELVKPGEDAGSSDGNVSSSGSPEISKCNLVSPYSIFKITLKCISFIARESEPN